MSLTPRDPKAHIGHSFAVEKYHGAQNDFFFLRAPASCHETPDWQDVSRRICERRTGLGADGLILWDFKQNPPGEPLATMTIWNSDGTRAGTCGNALRCFGLCLLRHALWTGQHPLAVYAPSRTAHSNAPFAQLENARRESDRCADVTVDMGTWKEKYQLQTQAHESVENLLPEPWALRCAYFVQLANPHVVLLLKRGPGLAMASQDLMNLAQTRAETIKGSLRASGLLPTELAGGDVNLGLCLEDEERPGHAHLIVHERGAGLTQACGSGAVAAALVLQDPELIDVGIEQVGQWTIELPGGSLKITLSGRQAQMAGPAEYIGYCTWSPESSPGAP